MLAAPRLSNAAQPNFCTRASPARPARPPAQRLGLRRPPLRERSAVRAPAPSRSAQPRGAAAHAALASQQREPPAGAVRCGRPVQRARRLRPAPARARTRAQKRSQLFGASATWHGGLRRAPPAWGATHTCIATGVVRVHFQHIYICASSPPQAPRWRAAPGSARAQSAPGGAAPARSPSRRLRPRRLRWAARGPMSAVTPPCVSEAGGVPGTEVRRRRAAAAAAPRLARRPCRGGGTERRTCDGSSLPSARTRARPPSAARSSRGCRGPRRAPRRALRSQGAGAPPLTARARLTPCSCDPCADHPPTHRRTAASSSALSRASCSGRWA